MMYIEEFLIYLFSKDKTAIIWDLNRKQYVKTLDGHENGVQFIRINDTTVSIVNYAPHRTD